MNALIERARRSLAHHFSALAAMAMRGAGVVAAFVVTALIGRWYGPVANAQYALVTQTAMFLSVIAVGGADLAVTREFSRSVAEGNKLARRNCGGSWGKPAQLRSRCAGSCWWAAIGCSPISAVRPCRRDRWR